MKQPTTLEEVREIENQTTIHPKYRQYRISRYGFVYSHRSHTVLTNSKKADGYIQVGLYSGGGDVPMKIVRKYLHRLVAEVFIDNPLRLKEVNHKDGDKSNCRWDNLEWITHADNIKHSYEVLGRVTPKGKDHWAYGKVASDATKYSMSVAKIGDKHPKFKGWYISPEGIEYTSPGLAESATGINSKSVYRWSNSGKNGWSFRKKDSC